MKKIAFILIAISLVGFCGCSKSGTSGQGKTVDVQLKTDIYQLYPTQNIWTFIKLDTRNGLMWQVQFSVKGDEYRFEDHLNITPLASNSASGRFELYPTQNIYNFVLLDKTDGSTWQVQWSNDEDNRGIVPISKF